MKRLPLLLSVLGVLLVIALFFVVIFQPAREDLAEIEAQIEQQLDQQRSLEAEIARLRSVRQDAPGVEAELAAADAIIPRDAALPALIRQLQSAADDAGVALLTVSTTRPTELPDAPDPGLSTVGVDVQLEGGYFQTVDFLRRIEDPGITSRGVLWSNVAVTRIDDTYPDLTVSLTGDAFAVLAVPLPAEPEPQPDAEEAETEDPDAVVEDDVEVSP